MSASISPENVSDMIAHWLNTPANSCLGSNYGHNFDDLIAAPLAGVQANAVIKKLLNDVPVLQVLPAGSVNIYKKPTGPDRIELILEVAGTEFTLTG